MGTFDISRINFDKAKHYTSVRMQQGRVLTDDDWNENARIENEIQRESNADIIGPFGSPDEGFKIDNLRLDSGLINFDILPGTLYLGGLRLELEVLETYRLQKDWLQQPVLSDGTLNFNENERYDLIYLESWQQPVSAVEDSSLFEVALGGPDTTTRLRNMRRVHLSKSTGFGSCTNAWNKLINDWQSWHLGSINKEFERIKDTLLKVSYSKTGLPEDLCTPGSAGGYLGAENQAIRVQLVDENHFTWGFDNASPLYRVAVSANGKKVKMLTEPKDQYHWLLSNQVVEILPWSSVLSNSEKVADQMGHLTKVESSYNPDTGEFTLQDAVASTFGIDWKSRSDKNDLDDQIPAEYFYLRVWNRGNDGGPDAKIEFTTEKPIDLDHTGLQITITGNDRIAGDYWVIAARPETPNRVIPWELEQGVPPHGIRRFFAPLAVIKWTKTPAKISGEVMNDCRRPFTPLTEESCMCITVKPKQGWEKVFEKFRDGQDICICFKNGIYELDRPVIITNKGNIKFTGCGKGSQIIIYNSEAAFEFIKCKDIVIRDLSVENKFVKRSEINFSHLQGVINISACNNLLFENITVACKRSNKAAIRQQTCITINASAKGFERPALTTVSIQNSRFNIDTMQTGLLIIDADKISIEGNALNGTGANQGIVVAGVNPQSTCIRNNSIQNVFQGIHVGASNSKLHIKKMLSTGPVIISGNNIECLLTPSFKRERHGIFVGNCNSLVMNENYILLKKQNSEGKIWPSMNGIRVFGHFGKRIIIRDNHLDGFGYIIVKTKRKVEYNSGILIHYLNSQNTPRWWIVETNVTEKLRIEGPDRLIRTPKMIYADRWRVL